MLITKVRAFVMLRMAGEEINPMVDRDELADMMITNMFKEADANKDDFVDEEEMAAIEKQIKAEMKDKKEKQEGEDKDNKKDIQEEEEEEADDPEILADKDEL